MLLNYLKLAVRLLIRNPFFTLINVLGLSIGFTSFYVLWPYAQSELKSDQFHKDYEQIARLSRCYEFREGEVDQSIYLPVHNSGIAKQFLNDYDEITDLTRILPKEMFERYRQGFDKDVFISVIKKENTKEFFRENRLVYADPNFFDFFSFPIINGDPNTFLAKPNTVVLSEKNAQKYFGNENPVNKTIYLNDTIPLTVTGVFKDLPKNTHFVFDLLLSTAEIKGIDLPGWMTVWWSYCYIKVRKGTDFQALQNKINKHNKQIYGVCPNCPAESTTSAFIQPLKEIVFTNLIANSFTYKSEYLLITLKVLSFVILILAWINYISLSIHLLQKRLKEIGTRKVVGAGGRDFILQFLTEAAIINLLSFLIALTLVQLTKTPVEKLFNFYTIPWHALPSSTIWIQITMLVSGVAITSSYPILLSMHKQSILLLKKFRTASSPSWINVILTVQYAAAIVLLIWIGSVYFQLNLVLSKNLGIEKDGIVVVDCPLDQKEAGFKSKLEYFVAQTKSIGGIQHVSVSKSIIGDVVAYGIPLQRNKNDIEWGFDTNGGVDENFLTSLGIKLLYGRNFQPDMPSDKRAILLSKAATARMGFSSPEEALGAKLILPWHGHDDAEVIGIYEDYEFRPSFKSQYQGARGSFLSYKDYLIPDFYPSRISVKINLDHVDATMNELELFYKEVFPQETFRWAFLDDNITKHYQNEKTTRNQITIFTLIAIGIASLGLLGMISNRAIEKTKEIGIRKVLGAEILHITQILLNTTAKQIFIATIIGIPVAYFIIQQYLQKFTDRIVLHWWHFALPLVILILIMLSTIVSVIWRATMSNPVEALKHE